MSDTPNKWVLPEFGLLTHVHHNTYKKLKLNPALNPTLKSYFAVPASHAEGYEKGYSEGLAKATQESNAQKQRLEALIQQLHADSDAIENEREDALCRFVKSLCEKIIYKELSLSPDVLKNMITQALKMIDNSGKEIRIHCHQKLYENLHSDKFDSYTRVVFEVNNQLAEYDFTLESDKQKICFNVDVLLAKLLEEILICNSPK